MFNFEGEMKPWSRRFSIIAGVIFLSVVIGLIVLIFSSNPRVVTVRDTAVTAVKSIATNQSSTPIYPPLDIATYNAKMLELANIPTHTVIITTTSTVNGKIVIATSTKIVSAQSNFPTKAPYPDAGAILPFKRVVAYYGNLYSKQMGVLGEYPSAQMLQMLTDQANQWAVADPSTPVVPALDYIVVTAQASAGADGKYRARMPDSQVQLILSMAQQINAIVILDVQVGLSNVQTEVPLLEQYLKLPQVHLALDPEFDMHNGERPGSVIGTMDASDINWAANYLAGLVDKYNLPPKMLIIHRFTDDMVTNTDKIAPLPQVQIVMDMDGFGFPAKKINTYQQTIIAYPVQFSGFKLFYKNDANATNSHLMTPQEVLKLSPQPSFIQYQ